MINGSKRPYWDIETKKVGIFTDKRFVINAGLFPGGMVVLYVFSQSNMTIVGKYQAHEDNNVNWEMAHPSMKDKAGNKLLNLAIEKEGAVSLKIKWNNIHELKFIRNRYLHISK